MTYKATIISSLSLCVSLMAASAASIAQESETKSGTFATGSVAMMCTAPKDRDVIDAQFGKALPRWMETLQNLANEGVVVRAHHLGSLKDGIFVVITGDTPQDALNNAVLASYELSQIFIDATGIKNFNSCTYTQLGPAAVLPTVK